MFIVFDLEITDSSREHGRIIEIGAIAVRQDDVEKVEGTTVGSFSRKVNPDGRGFGHVNKQMMERRGLHEKDLLNEDKFDVVGKDFVSWMKTMVREEDVGVLVAHNGSVDFQFLALEFQRTKGALQMPPNVQTTLCTLQNSKLVPSYLSVDDDAWPALTQGLSKSFTSAKVWLLPLHSGDFCMQTD